MTDLSAAPVQRLASRLPRKRCSWCASEGGSQSCSVSSVSPPSEDDSNRNMVSLTQTFVWEWTPALKQGVHHSMVGCPRFFPEPVRQTSSGKSGSLNYFHSQSSHEASPLASTSQS